MMNPYQQQLYTDLMSLCKDSNGTFIYKDVSTIMGTEQNDNNNNQCCCYYYRMFNYRLVTYADFCKDNALECRGVMFLMQSSPVLETEGKGKVEESKTPLRLVALPMEKFFNLGENPSTTNLDMSKIVDAEHKLDGSLISTYLDYTMVDDKDSEKQQRLRLKTKFSLNSKQVIDATNWLLSNKRTTTTTTEGTVSTNFEYSQQLERVTAAGYTVNLEWTGPNNQIVVPYMEEALKVLNVRSCETGDYVQLEELQSHFAFETNEISTRWTDKIKIPTTTTVDHHENNENNTAADWSSWIEKVMTRKGLEGYVLRFENGMRVKVKTEWYRSFHSQTGQQKSSLLQTSDRALFDAIVDAGSDDIRDKLIMHQHENKNESSLLMTDKVHRMEQLVCSMHNSMIQSVEDFYHNNQDSDVKSYMIQAQQVLPNSYFPLAVSLYKNKKVDYQKVTKSRWEEVKVLLESQQQQQES